MTITEKRLPSAWARSRTFSTSEDLTETELGTANDRKRDLLPSVGEYHIPIFDFLARKLFYDFIGHDDPFADIIVNFVTECVFGLCKSIQS